LGAGLASGSTLGGNPQPFPQRNCLTLWKGQIFVKRCAQLAAHLSHIIDEPSKGCYAKVGVQHPCQAQAPVNVGGRPPGRPLANPRTRKSADRNGLTLCESQIPVEKGRNFDILQRQSPGVLGTLARISPWVKLSAEPSCRPPRQEGSLLRYPAAIPAS